jgi:putative Mg2+ transporter-C (MgtC) family protein
MTEWLSAFHAEHRESIEMLLRLVFATVSGMAIGLNRDLHGKPMGMRTLGLVSLSSALVVMAGSAYGHVHFEEDAFSRVVQGVLTGIGFLGAGVILRRQDREEVHGLTTAATVWMAAALGVTAGVGAWFITIVGNGLALSLLVFGKSVERSLNSLFGGRKESAED